MSKRRAVVDEDLPRAVDILLERSGWSVYDVRDHGLRGRDDREVMAFARKQRAVLFTADWGFANILAFPPHRHFGVVMLNFPNEASTALMIAETEKALREIKRESFRKKLVVVEPGKIRIRS